LTNPSDKTVTVRLYAAARAAASQGEFLVEPGRLDEILGAIARHNPRLSQVFEQCSFLVDGVVSHEKNVQINARSTVDVLPPFAGG